MSQNQKQSKHTGCPKNGFGVFHPSNLFKLFPRSLGQLFEKTLAPFSCWMTFIYFLAIWSFILLIRKCIFESKYIQWYHSVRVSRTDFISVEKRCKKTLQMSSPPKALRATKVMVTKPVKKRSKSSSGLVRARSRLELISTDFRILQVFLPIKVDI